jgi:glucose dehydrogenase
MIRFAKIILVLQAVYLSFPSVWALVDIESFMEFTGPKTDTWLVKTMSGILLVIGITLLVPFITGTLPTAVIYLAITHALVLACADFYYASGGELPRIYFADAGIHAFFVLSWLIIIVRTMVRRPQR